MPGQVSSKYIKSKKRYIVQGMSYSFLYLRHSSYSSSLWPTFKWELLSIDSKEFLAIRLYLYYLHMILYAESWNVFRNIWNTNCWKSMYYHLASRRFLTIDYVSILLIYFLCLWILCRQKINKLNNRSSKKSIFIVSRN